MSLFKRLRILKIDPDFPEKEAINIAADIIKHGGLVAFPTETVYGLGADYANKKAVKRIYKVKKRPENKPLTLHISDMEMLKSFVVKIPELGKRLMKRFWPGPLTIILNSNTCGKLGFRMPKNKVALELIKRCAVPIVAPSANMSGSRPPRDTGEVI